VQPARIPAYSCWAVAASHRASRTFHKRWFSTPLNVDWPTSSSLHNSPERVRDRCCKGLFSKQKRRPRKSVWTAVPRSSNCVWLFDYDYRILHRPSSEVVSNQGVNPVGLLACSSSGRSCLPSAFAPVANMLLSSLLTVAGPRRIFTGFPCNTESQILYGSLQNSVKDWSTAECLHLPDRKR